jgi:DNA-binding XRE family transcriptional regulator
MSSYGPYRDHCYLDKVLRTHYFDSQTDHKVPYGLYIDQTSIMPKSITRTYSRYSREASTLLGGLIRVARIERKLTAQIVADRAGISRGLLQRIEKGDLKCEIGAVFEVAVIVGVKLFDADSSMIKKQLRRTEEKLMLLPKSVRKKTRVVRDDF